MKQHELDLIIAHKLVAKSDKCKDKGIEFDLSFEKVKTIAEEGKCAYTGEVFSSVSGAEENSMSLERIDPRVGYVDNNVVGICHWLNRFKGRTLDAFLHCEKLTVEAKIKILRKALYRLEKGLKVSSKGESENNISSLSDRNRKLATWFPHITSCKKK